MRVRVRVRTGVRVRIRAGVRVGVRAGVVVRVGLGFSGFSGLDRACSDSEQSDEHDEKPWSGLGSGRGVRVRIRI